ncbi:MAG: hypothetical protein VB070_01975 [Clostridiaceae bacterium]|nr:hypothetical protein [Clostridiaceae bacterium]
MKKNYPDHPVEKIQQPVRDFKDWLRHDQPLPEILKDQQRCQQRNKRTWYAVTGGLVLILVTLAIFLFSH